MADASAIAPAAGVAAAGTWLTDRPLRIAQMLESDGPGGAEVVLLQLAEELERRGHTVVHIGPVNGVGWLGERIREAGMASDTFTLRRAVDPSCAGRLADTLRRHRIDVVHSHEFTMCVYGAAAARRLGIPHVTTMHGNQKMTKKLRRRVALRWAFRQTRTVVACSEATRQDLLEQLGVPPATIHTIRNGVPERVGRGEPVRAELGLAGDDVLIVCIGNIVERKGHIVLLRALAELEDRGETMPWQVAIAGAHRDGAPALRSLIAERGWESRVHLLGARDDVPDLLAAADILAMPSLWEGLPLAILEAMFAGLPVVASRTSGIPEAVLHERTGLLVEPGQPAPLAAALHRLLADPALRLRMGEAGRQRAREEFSIARMTDRYLAAYAGGRA